MDIHELSEVKAFGFMEITSDHFIITIFNEIDRDELLRELSSTENLGCPRALKNTGLQIY